MHCSKPDRYAWPGSSAGWDGGVSSTSPSSPGVENRISTVATWLATIARARRTDRTFILGGTTSPEHPYTWLKTFHPNMLPVAQAPVDQQP